MQSLFTRRASAHCGKVIAALKELVTTAQTYEEDLVKHTLLLYPTLFVSSSSAKNSPKSKKNS